MSVELEPFYRVVEADDRGEGCEHCGHGKLFVIVKGHGDDEEEVSAATTDKEGADEICESMNEAFREGFVRGKGSADK